MACLTVELRGESPCGSRKPRIASRGITIALGALTLGVLATGLGACAGPAAPAPAPATTADVRSLATIVSMRSVMLAASPGVAAGFSGVSGTFAGSDIRLNILGAVGGIVVATPPTAATPAVEFIVREDDAAQPVSVVQANTDGLHPGDRVVLTRGARTRLARAGA